MKKLKVLIVDDSAEDTRKAALLLKNAGHAVIVASNGMEGVAMAKQQLPDLILMDIVMPGLNGFQATRQLSHDEVTRNIPVIVVSGKDQETDKVWAMRQGAKAYLTKTIEKKILLDTIGDLMS
ncbi:MAG: response regulator [Pseudomonadales bacterium]|nr:response regulator [Pseudomonadales bacterium]